MSVGFGFSAGDFIAALQLVSTVIDALRDSGDSSTEYRALISQLYTLETALLTVKRIEADDDQCAEVIALRQAACQCQRTIDAFWEKIKKYQLSLRTGGSGSRVRDGWRKIQWALCKKDDLLKFKADLVGHTESIELLLTTLHMGSTHIGRKKQNENQKTLTSCVTSGVEQGKKILEMTAQVIQTNVQVFHIVLNIQSIITKVPGQVERQQPVFLIDAIGRYAPFHLEFVLSAEALTHVLRSNFKNIGSGSQKIDRGEFAIQDTSLKRDIDLNGPWDGCFRPGQRVDMSMIFTSQKNPNQSCPACQQDHNDGFKENQDMECINCSIIFRRTVGRASDTSLYQFQAPLSYIPSVTEENLSLQQSDSGKFKRKRFEEAEDDVALFRRVRIKTKRVASRCHTWSCAALSGYAAAFQISPWSPPWRPNEADTCGYCGEDFPRSGISSPYPSGRQIPIATEQDWEVRIGHLQEMHKFGECNHAKQFFRADHFRQHLKHSHAGTSGKWTNMLEDACMKDEPLQSQSGDARVGRINEEDGSRLKAAAIGIGYSVKSMKPETSKFG